MSLGDLVCFSHLRWDFVFQRPQHLMTRAARTSRVFFVEEPRTGDARVPHLQTDLSPEGVTVCRPVLPQDAQESEHLLQRRLVDELLAREQIASPVVWHYTPMAEPLSRGIDARAVIYDCMDELSSFRFAPPGLGAMEQSLLARADLVFTGGQSLYRAKRSQHPSVHAFPSGVDAEHFRRARTVPLPPMPDDMPIAQPRLMYVGVLDERIDMRLIDAVAAARPGWSVVLVGPVAKVDMRDLPSRSNVFWLGMKPYAELPNYLAHADVGIMPFALNEATRYISPTKTPEYLAAGLSVVSTPILDVVQPYGNLGLVRIADDPASFVDACERAMGARPSRRTVEKVLARGSWDAVWAGMSNLIEQLLLERGAVTDIQTASGLA